MRAALKSIFCWDMPTVDLEHWVLETKEFGFKVVLFIGAEDDQKSDSFDAFGCTPGFFAANMADDQIASGQYTFFVRRFDYQKLRQCIENYVSRCEGNSWSEGSKEACLHWLLGIR
jgi:hypothetical protein